MRAIACVLAVSTCVVVNGHDASAQARSSAPLAPQPSIRASDETRGFLGGLAAIGAGSAFGLLGFGITLAVVRDKEGCPDFCDYELLIATAGGQVGLGLGSALVVNKIGDHRGGRGSFGVSVAGAVVGSGLSWLLATSPLKENDGALALAFFALPIAGAIGGYWATHEHDPPALGVVPANLAGSPGIIITGRF